MAIKENSQTRRRLIFGSNVILGIIIVWAIVVLVNFVFAKLNLAPVDMTRGGQFSISPRTEKLLENLKDEVTLTAIYDSQETGVKEVDEQSRQQKRQVEDLLRRYRDISGKVSCQTIDPIKDTTAKTALVSRLIKRYSGEAAQHKKVIDEFRSINEQIIKLTESECAMFDKLKASNTKVLSNNLKIQAIMKFFTSIKNQASVPLQQVDNKLTGDDIPAYSDAVEIIQQLYESLRNNLKASVTFLTGEGLKIEGLQPDALQAFESSASRYRSLIDAMDQQLVEIPNLPKLELEQIYNTVKQKNAKTIVVEAENSPKVKVLGFDDVWKMNQRQTFEFNGEAALSSAIMALTQKDKTAVIFVHAGQPNPIKPGFNGTRMTPAPYSAVKEKLEQANFVVEDWDMQTAPQPPTVPQSKGRVFVVVPSMPQKPQQQGAPENGYKKEHVDQIAKLIDKGERMIFLINCFPTMLFGQEHPFTQLLRDKFGINADAEKLILHGMRTRDNRIVATGFNVNISRYEYCDITKPIQSLNSGFYQAVPLLIEKKLPQDVKLTPLVCVQPELGEYWAESNIITLQQQGTASKGDDKNDMSPPFYLAIAAHNSKTKCKAVVFSNDIFATDEMIGQAQTILTNQGFAAILINPANAELFTNSAFWLNDNANMISVGPRGTDVPRVSDISDKGLMAWKIFLWVIWPMSALVLGGIVYVVRQK